MISDLLSKWARLEPDRCAFDREAEAFEISIADGSFQMLYPHSHNPLKLTWLMGCVLEAIAHHKALYKLENDTAGRHYALVRGCDRFRVADDDNPAIALLAAYVAWLEALNPQTAEVGAA